jgi:hypothetical protein
MFRFAILVLICIMAGIALAYWLGNRRYRVRAAANLRRVE